MKLIGSLAGILLLLGFAITAALLASRPQIDGSAVIPGLSDTVTVRRDAIGHTTLEAQSRLDLAHATGFVHAQERFFSMDIRRRFAAGTLAALIGPPALPLDEHNLKHRFDSHAQRLIDQLPAAKRELLEAYTAGVNQGLETLPVSPFPYFLVLQTPQPWAAKDSLLSLFAMHLILQGRRWQYEATVSALTQTFGEDVANFLAPVDTHHAAPLDDSPIPWYTPDIPQVPDIDLRHIPLDPDNLDDVRARWERKGSNGSNALAVSGALTEHGHGLLANDMHLALLVPNIWYRMHWEWQEGQKERMASGLSLPGLPWLVAGSNGDIAWGFTNSNIDAQDLILLSETEPLESIQIPRDVAFSPDPEALAVPYSRWGPVLTELGEPAPALRWASHWVTESHINFRAIEQARNITEAMTLFQQSAIPPQNVLIVDRHGNAGWTIAGALFQRTHHNGRTAVSSDQVGSPAPQWLAAEDYPSVFRPRLWSANQRHLGGTEFELLGDGRYTAAMRGRQLKKRLQAHERFTETDLLAIQLDARADYLEEWRVRLIQVLESPGVMDEFQHHRVREHLESWDGYAHPHSVGYRLVRGFRKRTHELFLKVLHTRMEQQPGFQAHSMRWQLDGPLTRIIEAEAQNFLPRGYANWNEVMALALRLTLEELTHQGTRELSEATWGEINPSQIRHPLSHILPFLGPYLDSPSQPQAGDLNLPRVARPSFGASHRTIVSPGREEHGILHMPGGQSGHPLSPFYNAGHEDWAEGRPTPFLPGPDYAILHLEPAN